VEMSALRQQQCKGHFGEIGKQLLELRNKIDEQFASLDEKLQTQIDERKDTTNKEIDYLKSEISKVQNDVADMKEDRNKQLINWGTAIIATLISSIALLIVRVILPLLTAKIPNH